MDINRYTPSYGVAHRNLINTADLSAEELFEFLYAARAMKAKFLAHEDTRILQGVTVALLFDDTSLRTRSALEIGIRQLGGTCVNLPYNENDMRAGENVKDLINVISRYGVGAIVTRGIPQSELLEYCSCPQISIINSNNEHGMPMQTVCDLFTIWEKFGKLEGLKLAYVGKAGSNAVSLIDGAVKCGMEVAVARPKQYKISEEVLNGSRQYGDFLVTENPAEAVRGADIVYTDAYNYHDPLTDKEREILLPYQINKSLMSFAGHNAQFMHSLPATRGAEVTADIIDGKNSLVLTQAENKLHAVKSVLALLA